MKQDITESFITSTLELKLDQATMFEWQRHSQDSNDVPHYVALLEFLHFRAQASEMLFTSRNTSVKHPRPKSNVTRRHHHTQLMWMTVAWFASWADTPCILVGKLGVYNTSKW